MCMYYLDALITVTSFCLFLLTFLRFEFFHDRQIQLETTLTHVEDTLSQKTMAITHFLLPYQVNG